MSDTLEVLLSIFKKLSLINISAMVKLLFNFFL